MTKTTTRPAWDQVMTRAAVDGIVPNVINRVLLFGWSRSGKSTLPETIWGRDNCRAFTCFDGMPTDDLFGNFAPGEDGKFRWTDGVVTDAMRNGRKLIINEIDQGVRGEMRYHLHAIMDDPAAVTLCTGERVIASPGFAVIGTMNPENPEKLLPTPIFDRFDLILPVYSMSDGLRRYLGDLAKPAEAVLGRGGDGLTRWVRPATVNLFIAAAKLRKHGLADNQIAEALGLHGREAADFLTAIAR